MPKWRHENATHGVLSQTSDPAIREAMTIASAGYDTTPVGRAAMESLVGFKCTAALLDTTNAQGEKLRKIIEVSKIRAVEAQRMVAELADRTKTDPKAMYWQIAGGKGFGNPNSPKKEEKGGLLGALGAMGKKEPEPEPKMYQSSWPEKVDTNPRDPPIIDMDGMAIQANLRDLVALTRRNVRDAAFFHKTIAHADRVHNITYRAEEDMFKFPGAYPPTPLQKVRATTAINRPRDLAPSWMEFLYSWPGYGQDPYREFPDPAGLGQQPQFTEIKGREVQNPFGNPPLPVPWSGEERGYEGRAGKKKGIGMF